MTSEPITFAHRGGRADAPENSLEAFERALTHGARGLESDARLSADGQAVLCHGPAVRRGLRRVPVHRLRADELAAHGIPTLGDLYGRCGTDFELSLDLKAPGVLESVLRVAGNVSATEQLWLCSTETRVLSEVRRADETIRRVHSMGRRLPSEGLEGHAAELARDGVRALNLHERAWTLGVVTLAHRFGLLAFAWDVQEVRRLRALLEMGVDALYSDHVDRMVAAVGEWGTRP